MSQDPTPSLPECAACGHSFAAHEDHGEGASCRECHCSEYCRLALTPSRPEGETERARQMLGSREFKVIGANERGSLLECEQCHAVVSASDIGGHSCPTPPARERVVAVVAGIKRFQAARRYGTGWNDALAEVTRALAALDQEATR